MTAAFSPDSKYLALGTPNEHIKNEEFSPDDAFDLSIYNNETNEMQVIVQTDEEHNLFPIEWINRETIHYKKVHVFNREEKELTIKLNLAVKDLEVLTYDEERKKVHINLPIEMKAYKVEKDILPYYTITNHLDEYIGEFGTVRQGSEILEATLHVPWDELIKSEKVQTKLGEGTLNWLTVRENSKNKENEVNSPYLIYVHVPDGNDGGQYYSHHLILEVEERSDFEKIVPLVKKMFEP